MPIGGPNPTPIDTAVQAAGDRGYSRSHWLQVDEPKSPLPAGHDKSVASYVIALGGIAMIVVGLWSLYILIRERVAELRLRDYMPTIQAIAIGFVLIGLTRAFAAVAPDFCRELPY